MSNEPPSPTGEPLGSFEYELTEDLAFQSAQAHFAVQARTVKESVAREGVHPALPIIMASIFLIAGVIAVSIWSRDSWTTLPLIVAACLAQLLLLYKAALYFCPPFARWYLRHASRRLARQLSGQPIRWTFFADRLETSTSRSQRSLPWTELQQVRTLPELWCLHWQSGLILFAPVSMLSNDLQTLIRRKADDVGALIVAD